MAAHDRSIRGLLSALDEASALNPSITAEQGAAISLRAKVLGPLLAIIEQALEWIGDIEDALSDDGRGSHLESDGYGWTLVEEEGMPVRARRAYDSEITDLCFAARCELRATRRRLLDVGPRATWLRSECEAAASKVQRALAAVVDAVVPEHGATSRPFQNPEVQTAVLIRSLYTQFRWSLVPHDVEEVDSIGPALERVLDRLNTVIGSPLFASVRSADDMMLRALQARVAAWLTGTRDATDGVRLYQDVVTTANLLRGINLRQELQIHDAVVVEAARQILHEHAMVDGEMFRQLAVRLDGLLGRDDQFDALLKRARNDESIADLVPQFERHLQRLAGHLPG